jgi:hypothetical protein
MRKTASRLIKPMSSYTSADITQANFPALKHFWDMNHVSGAYLLDTVGNQHAKSSSGHWMVDADGFSKWSINGGQYLPADFEAPGDRDFMLIGCGIITWKTRAFTIGQAVTYDRSLYPQMITADPIPAGIAFDISSMYITPSAYYDASNMSDPIAFPWCDDLATGMYAVGENLFPYPGNRGVEGCFATVISPSNGTTKMYWAGRVGETAAYDTLPFEEINCTITGNIKRTWPVLGGGLTMFPGNRFEWVALLYFDNGVPTDIKAAICWMAQHNDIRLYPGWIGKT